MHIIHWDVLFKWYIIWTKRRRTRQYVSLIIMKKSSKDNEFILIYAKQCVDCVLDGDERCELNVKFNECITPLKYIEKEKDEYY